MSTNASATISVIVVDDHAAVRLGLMRLLDGQADLDAVAAVADERQLRAALEEIDPDVVIVDYDLSRGDGLAICHALKQRRPAPAAVVYTAYAGPALRVSAAVAQADALVDKAEPPERLLDAVRRVAAGERLIEAPPPQLMHAAAARLDAGDLPIVAMLLDGAGHDEIAQALGELDRTDVSHRVRRVLGRLRTRSTQSHSA
jgi:DNA-binding NarL/FixJ family response regulator